MNNHGLLGALLPIWIIGAPLVGALIMLMRTPRPSPRSQRDSRDQRDLDPMRDRTPGATDNVRPVPVPVPSPGRF